MKYLYNKETNKYYSKKSKELHGCARYNCEIHRLCGWDTIKESFATMLEIINMQDKQISSLKDALKMAMLMSSISQNSKKF